MLGAVREVKSYLVCHQLCRQLGWYSGTGRWETHKTRTPCHFVYFKNWGTAICIIVEHCLPDSSISVQRRTTFHEASKILHKYHKLTTGPRQPLTVFNFQQVPDDSSQRLLGWNAFHQCLAMLLQNFSNRSINTSQFLEKLSEVEDGRDFKAQIWQEIAPEHV